MSDCNSTDLSSDCIYSGKLLHKWKQKSNKISLFTVVKSSFRLIFGWILLVFNLEQLFPENFLNIFIFYEHVDYLFRLIILLFHNERIWAFGNDSKETA